MIRQVLEKYGIKSDFSIKQLALGLNKETILINCHNKKYILKSYSNNSKIEPLVIDYLSSEGLPVPKVFRNIDGQITTKEGSKQHAIFKYCPGVPITWNNLSDNLAEDIAKTIALMHRLLKNKKFDSLHVKKSLIDKGLVKDKEVNGLRQSIIKSSEKLDTIYLRKGVIHGDLTRQNILVDENEDKVTAIIDFGDCHYDYIAWDLAILITHIFITKSYGIDWNALETFFKKYLALFPLDEKETAVIIPFMKIRNINLAVEVVQLLEKDSENDELKSILNSVLRKIDLIDLNQQKLREIINC
ncbi:MAG: Aminoglycoside phosphotransferase/class-III aminotransferase [candidate division TM6 bacterium GW2011_GWF2_37_49]|nr:MAG: Aminoglycoside phosphotransferase/class-III aminotransferase [candidate division TM6 bacterium GW2011_GWF2_37_49]